MQITFIGAAKTVTGSCHLVETEGCKFLVDCGMFQGGKEIKARNYQDFPFNPAEIDFVLLTHAHIDHSGLLPKLILKGFKGRIYATGGTVDLCSVMLPDSGYIQEMEVERKNRKAMRSGAPLLEPIYTSVDGQEAMKYFTKISYGKEFRPVDSVRVIYKNAGHILGSGMAEVYVEEEGVEKKLLFSGDLGRIGRPIIQDPEYIKDADVLIIESTYGDRRHGEIEDLNGQLRDVINRTFARGGNVVIPAFAVDRAQDLLLTLNELCEKGEINPKGIYLDSPLAIAATEIFSRYPQYYDMEIKAFSKKNGGNPFVTDRLVQTRTAQESQALNEIKTGAIIISASGMADAGRIKHHLKHNLWRKESTVIFVGYLAEGTLGRRIVDGAQVVTIHGEQVTVNAEIVNLDALSAHADYVEILEWLEHFETYPDQVFIVHGEEKSALALKEKIEAVAAGSKVHVPDSLTTFDLLLPGRVTKPHAVVEQDLLSAINYFSQISARLSQMVKDGDYGKLKEIAQLLEQYK